MTCGSVDDGKSTLVGRLIYDQGLLAEDHLASLLRDSRGRPCGPEGLDFSLLLDGLEAEREQGITIDVAYRYLKARQRSVIVADAPGHEQYTRNMVTAASNAGAALLLVDVRKGVLAQTRRHAAIVALLGITNAALVVNKLDLVDFAESAFRTVVDDFREFAGKLGLAGVVAIPVSALTGANVARPHDGLAWHRGGTLLDWLEMVPAGEDLGVGPFRMPVQWVNRASSEFRGLSGLIASGQVSPGDRIGLRSGATSTVARIVTMEGDLPRATAGQAVTVVLGSDVDAARGDLLFDPEAPPIIADQFAAHLVWLGDERLLPNRSYLLRIGTELLAAQVTDLNYRLDLETSEKAAAKVLNTNEVGFCKIRTARPICMERYRDNKKLGSFILIDRVSRATVGAGMIEYDLHRSANVRWQNFDVNPRGRAAQKGQSAAIIWFTGLSGAGKSTIANEVDRRLYALGYHTFILDGDNVRHGLNADLGFTDADRVENIRRISEVARLMADAGLIVLVPVISPFRIDRRVAREIAGDIPFREVFIDASLEVCESRDTKGLYKKARAGQIANFTGVSSPYERPEAPDLRLSTDGDLEECVSAVLSLVTNGT